MEKKRLDNLLIERGLFETKSKAQAAIMAGDVKINGEKITKAGFQIKDTEDLNIEIQTMPYVSRGGFKLEKAIKSFNIDFSNKICLDAGASTGGFTDCLLQNGASKIYAVDVGYGQIAWKLREDPRVKVIEKTNIKNCQPEDIYDNTDEKAEFAVMDLSFISITKVLPNIKKMLSKQQMVALIKPQFEAGREQIGKNGVVTDKKVHIEVIKSVISYAKTINLFPKNLTYSSIKGPAGNIEYLIYLTDEPNYLDDDKIQSVADEAFEILN
ncbi:MAG TPA: TlyA family RNA methyltransferase [Candidatus Adamsella sp.]|nr:TlyA family RNA methyltransferase [Candidatus Adamsella sp.]